MSKSKLAAALAATAVLALAPTAVAADPTGLVNPGEPAPGPDYPTYLEVLNRCKALHELAEFAVYLHDADMYLAVDDAYGPQCERLTGPLPAWPPS